jgi:hypothetical protein
MISRTPAAWCTVLGALVANALAIGACSSDDPKGATVDQESSPIFTGSLVGNGDDGNGDGSGTLFEEGDTPNPGTGGFDSNQACVGQEAGTERSPAILELLVDTSTSMDEDAPGSDRSKWIETRRVLLDGIDSMPNTTSVGVVFYPDVDTNAPTCFDREADVAVEPLGAGSSPQRAQIREAFRAESPRGSTPTHDAYRYALDELARVNRTGERFLVLITDGTPTYALDCQGSGTPQNPADPAPLVPEAASALGRGMRTFVIGSPGSEGARTSLSQMAEAGGTATPGCSHTGQPYYCHFDMTQEEDFSRGLEAAIASISGLALSCAYDVPVPPNGGTLDPSKVNVLFTPEGGAEELIPQSAPGACSDGWQYSADQRQILLCGDTCDRVKASNGQMSLQFGCTTSTRGIF